MYSPTNIIKENDIIQPKNVDDLQAYKKRREMNRKLKLIDSMSESFSDIQRNIDIIFKEIEGIKKELHK